MCKPATTTADASLASKVDALEAEINMLHDALQKRGVNSKQTADIFGRVFSAPVDQEHKGLALTLSDFTLPHGRAFHASWFGFFSSFFSMFAAAPLTAYMQKETSLNLNKVQKKQGAVAAVSSNIVMRVVTGFLCDTLGPRKALAFLLLASSPAVFGMMFVQNAGGWIACRAVIGIGLATFVTSQVWMSHLYNKKVVGLVNATSAGWGNLGGGVTNLTMPFIFQGFYSALSGETAYKEDLAWRLCYIVPLSMHILGALLALTCRDLPDGMIKELEASGAKQKSKGALVVKTGLTNVNAWILTITYGQCFGVELTMNSVAALYFYDYHGLDPKVAGVLASLYGLMNLFARSAGGLLSDWANKRYGMRGRLWACWIVQSIEGLFCILMAMVTLGMDAPFERPDTTAYIELEGVWHELNGTTVSECGSLSQAAPEWFREQHGIDDSLRMMYEPPTARGGDAANCIQHQSAVGLVVFLMICFSLCVQAAEGLHYGIVPYVSRPALGVVSGMVGAGGNLGAVIALNTILTPDIRRDTGFMRLGAFVIGLTATMFFIYFPDMGGMLFPKGSLGSYDPQLVKPPADYRGADSMDYSKKADTTKTADADVAVNAA